jgi:hypothetical protein
VFNHELEQDHSLARIAEVRAGLEVDVQLPVGLDEPKVAEPR